MSLSPPNPPHYGVCVCVCVCEIVLVFESEKEIIIIAIARFYTQRPTKVTFMKMEKKSDSKSSKTRRFLVLCLDDFIIIM